MINSNLTQLVQKAAQAVANRASHAEPVDWLGRLISVARHPDLQERIDLARSHRRAKRCSLPPAIPTWEPVDMIRASNAQPLSVTGVDGSQIYPFERSPVIWAYVQAVAYRLSTPPLFESQFIDIGSELQYHTELASDLQENSASWTALTNAWRTLLELRLARLASGCFNRDVILLDNGLLPWLSVSGQAASRHLQAYLNDLRGIAPRKAAGVVSGPQSRLLYRLIRLAEGNDIADGMQEDADSISDAALLRKVLQVGQRSALFQHGSPRNEAFGRARAAVFFFFLRIGAPEIVRVEIPEWVAYDPEGIDQVHASILHDSQATGYSYVLSQAHQQVSVPLEIASMLHDRATVEFWLATDAGPRRLRLAQVQMRQPQPPRRHQRPMLVHP